MRFELHDFYIHHVIGSVEFGYFRKRVQSRISIWITVWLFLQNSLYIDDETNYLLYEDGTMAEVAIVSFDKNTGETADYVRFNQNQSIMVAGK